MYTCIISSVKNQLARRERRRRRKGGGVMLMCVTVGDDDDGCGVVVMEELKVGVPHKSRGGHEGYPNPYWVI